MYKVVAVDLDGTLLDSSRKIIKETRDYLISLQNKGIGVVLVSGRDCNGIADIVEELELSKYDHSGVICLNGLEIYNSRMELLNKEEKLSYLQAQYLNEIARRYCLDIYFYFDHWMKGIEYNGSRIIDEFIGINKRLYTYIEEIDIDLFYDLRKVTYCKKGIFDIDLLECLRNELKDEYDLCLVEDNWIEINPKGIDKGFALRTYCELRGISLDEVIAFGNGENDISMLEVAGIGVAMGNAFEHVKLMADDVCDSNDNNGIMKYLRGEGYE